MDGIYNDFSSGYADGYYGGYGDYSGGYSSGSGFDTSQLESSLGQFVMTFIAIYMIIIVLALIVKLALYIIKGCGMYTLAKRQHVEYPGLAFVPFARFYIQGELSGDIVLKRKRIKNPGIWLIVLPIAWNVFFVITYIIFIGMMTAAGIAFASSSRIVGSFGGSFVFGVLLMVIAILFTAMIRGLTIMVNYQIYGRLTSNNMALVHAILGIFIPCYEAICMLVMSKKKYNPRFETYFTNLAPKYESTMPEENVPSARGLAGTENVQPVSDAMDVRNVQPASDIMDAGNVQRSNDIMDAENVRPASDIMNAGNVQQSSDIMDAASVRPASYVMDAVNVRSVTDNETATESMLVEGAIDALKGREVDKVSEVGTFENAAPEVIELPTSANEADTEAEHTEAEQSQSVQEIVSEAKENLEQKEQTAPSAVIETAANETYQFQEENTDEANSNKTDEI